jgi:SAM-dependent methyltransferase
MRSLMARVSLVVVVSLAAPVVPAFAVGQTTAAPLTDQQIFDKFVAWVRKLPPEAHEHPDRVEADYRKLLASEGLTVAEIERHFRVIDEFERKSEVDMWNRVLTAPVPSFNTKPNAFLVETTRGMAPGRALDVGMGQGRNALYLAQHGWTVTGFDPADKAVAVAQAEAKRLGVPLDAQVLRDDQFDFGKEQWNLIVFSYVAVRGLTDRAYDALRPGGMIVVEAFHRDATKTDMIGGDVVFDTNELLKLFARFRVIRYEDTEDIGDFGMKRLRLVRLFAQKP